jgi:FkbM family methyltransferase
MLSTKTKIQIAKALYHLITTARKPFGLTSQGSFKRKGIIWELDLSQGIELAIYIHGAFEPDTLRFYSKIIQPGDVVIDIGANIGAHTLHFAKLVGPKGKVLAFEPTDYAFSKLKKNLSLNPHLQARVIAFQTLLESGENKKPTFLPSSWDLTENPEKQKHPVHLGTYNTLENASVSTLDSILKTLEIPKVQFLKMDVDGYELEVLKGAQQSLKTHFPNIVMEISPHVYQEHGYNLQTLLKELQGYDILDFHQKNARLDKIPQGGSINVYLKRKT